jgi:hypothetical protein
MLSKVKWLLPLALLFLVSSGTAGIRPSFSLDYSAWEATNIVISSEGEVIDGKFLVIESLKGDVLSGETIEIPELSKFESRSSRLVKLPFGSKPDGPSQYVSGQRMILFLKRRDSTTKPSDTQRETTSPVWRAANLFDEMNASLVWLEGDKSFAFHQFMNPGPSELVENGKSEAELRIRILEVMQIRASFDQAASIVNGSSKAEALVPFATSEFLLSRIRAFQELEKGGQQSVSVLLGILLDETKLNFHDATIRSLVAIGGSRVGPALTSTVRREMHFWRGTAPQLKEGWWKSATEPDGNTLQPRYIKLRLALEGLKQLRFLGSKRVVSELRDFWSTVPLLDADEDVDGVIKDCEALLEVLSIRQ